MSFTATTNDATDPSCHTEAVIVAVGMGLLKHIEEVPSSLAYVG